jgi:hypothetical protein
MAHRIVLAQENDTPEAQNTAGCPEDFLCLIHSRVFLLPACLSQQTLQIPLQSASGFFLADVLSSVCLFLLAVDGVSDPGGVLS